jgi:hypothetical protein
MILRLIASVFLALTATAGQAFAWGHEGHEVVGAIADKLLNPQAKQQVAQILGFELRIAGPWADCVRGVVREPNGTFLYAPDPHHPEYRVPCTSFENAAETARMEDYASRNWVNCTYLPGRGCHESYHFTDVAIQHDQYDPHFAGTNKHDLVNVINAAILVLRGMPAPTDSVFSIKDKKEAIFLLAHFVGDLHQPLHVGSVYLDPSTGALVNPDIPPGLNPKSETAGGNKINDGHTNFHTEWDAIPANLRASAAMVKKARAITPTPGPIENWPATWATDTILASHAAFSGVTFEGTGHGHWSIEFDDQQQYVKDANNLKREQIAKAGARLAELLNAIWP